MTVEPRASGAKTFFLPAGSGDLYAAYYPAQGRRHGDVILLPPFAEEMNKSRRLFAMVSRALAANGYGALMVDLYGTGDSHGEFADARWEGWQQDVHAALQWLHKQGASAVSLLGLRLGAMLALAVAANRPSMFERLVLWQPVTSGELMLNQFLRLRLVAGLMAQTQTTESTSDLRKLVQENGSIEVAGYELSGPLFEAIDRLKLADLGVPGLPAIHWCDVGASGGRGSSPAVQRVLDCWRGRDLIVDTIRVDGPAFWSTVEITEVPELVRATVDIFKRAVT